LKIWSGLRICWRPESGFPEIEYFDEKGNFKGIATDYDYKLALRKFDSEKGDPAGKRQLGAKGVTMDKEVNIDTQTESSGIISLASTVSFLLPPEVAVLLPGLILTASISAIAIYTGAQLHYVTPLVVAMAVGILFRNAFILPSVYREGIVYSMRRVLRCAVALLGVRITFDTIASLGWGGLAIALVPLVLTLVATLIIGKLMKSDLSESLLIATGTSICGASAIMTVGAVTQAREDDVIVAISSITIFGTILMLTYPVAFDLGLFNLTDKEYGLWAGASIHEVAQVIAAAFGGNQVSGEIGTIIKLTRVAALVPFAFILSFLVANGIIKAAGGKSIQGGVKFPVFLFGFLGMVLLNSWEFFTPKAIRWIEAFDMFLLTMAMAAMGLETDFSRLIKIGFRPFLLSIFTTLFIAFVSLLLVKILA
jgi:uncharacterized integral membrane protein (TIGR00698 family)